jgi:hypothetical protein
VGLEHQQHLTKRRYIIIIIIIIINMIIIIELDGMKVRGGQGLSTERAFDRGGG